MYFRFTYGGEGAKWKFNIRLTRGNLRAQARLSLSLPSSSSESMIAISADRNEHAARNIDIFLLSWNCDTLSIYIKDVRVFSIFLFSIAGTGHQDYYRELLPATGASCFLRGKSWESWIPNNKRRKNIHLQVFLWNYSIIILHATKNVWSK